MSGVRTASAEIRIVDPRAVLNGEQLDISLIVEAGGVDLKTCAQLKLELSVEDSGHKLVLPPVIYAGNQRYRYRMRNAALVEQYVVEPYHIYRGVRSHDRYALEYRLSVPADRWMEYARIVYREYLYGCGGDRQIADGVLIADLSRAGLAAEPEIWKPDPDLFTRLVSFLEPETEEVKTRASMVELNVAFPVNVTEVRADYAGNRKELRRADSLIQAVSGNDLVRINGVSIKGYASPEGRYDANERLARGRSEGFRGYLAGNYPENRYVRGATTVWVAEDWEGLAVLVEESSLPSKEEVLAVIYDDAIAPDTKERILQKIEPWSAVYKRMLDEMFPKLRRIELRVDYTVSRLDDAKARELLYSQPDMLSLEEIYRVAKLYEPGSEPYREVYEIAARQYPDDPVANHNAAAALLQEGDAEAALRYFGKAGNDARSYLNYGAYYYVSGDLDRAVEYFTKAKDAGIGQAKENLELIDIERYQ